MKAYHGSSKNFEKFSKESIGKNADYGYYGYGIYFTPHKALARYYGKYLYECKLELTNPYITKAGSARDLDNELNIEKSKNPKERAILINKTLTDMGHNCVIIKDYHSNDIREICMFNVDDITILNVISESMFNINYDRYLLELKQYDPPMSIDQIKSKNFEHLLDDPIHKWRAETGIELIHMEPSDEELDRIFDNWGLMDKELIKKSDKKSNELFGIGNIEHYSELSNAVYELGDSKISGNGMFAKEDIPKNEDVGLAFVIKNIEDPDNGIKRLELGQFTNHSKSPNLKISKIDKYGHLHFIALKDIAKGDELTINYNSFPWEGKRDF